MGVRACFGSASLNEHALCYMAEITAFGDFGRF